MILDFIADLMECNVVKQQSIELIIIGKKILSGICFMEYIDYFIC